MANKKVWMRVVGIFLAVIIVMQIFLVACSQQPSSTSPSSSSSPSSPVSATSPSSMKPIDMTWSFFGSATESTARVEQEYITEISNQTDGKVKIVYYLSGSLTAAPVAYDGVVKGLSDMATVVLAYTPGRFPLTGAWQLPLPFPSGKVATQVFMNSYTKFKPVELSDTKVMYVFGVSPIGIQSKKEINTFADLRGLKIRCVGAMADLITAMGATPVSMPITDVYDALQKNIVDATANPPGVLYDFKLADIVKYSYAWNLGCGVDAVVMNLQTWNSLSSEVQKIFEDTNQKYISKEISENEANDQRAIEFAKSKGVQFFSITPEIEANIQTVIQPLYDKYVADMKSKGLPGQEFLDYNLQLIDQYK